MSDNILPSKSDERYNGKELRSDKCQYSSLLDFEEKLKATIDKFREDSICGVWFKILLEHSALVAVCAKHGFKFHHAQPEYVEMLLWLPKTENYCPTYANQYLGVGGFVVNAKEEVLVVKERCSRSKQWKFPGGHANRGEDLADTAIREVFEETGVKCEFVSIIAFRHQHGYKYGCSDFYFMCLLKPITEEINYCKREIADCQWMDIDEFLSLEGPVPVNKHFAKMYKINRYKGLFLKPEQVLSYNGKTHHNVYAPYQFPL